MATHNEEKRLKIEELYYAYRNLMYKVAYEILKDHHMAEDAINESFIRIMNNLHKITEINCHRTRNFLVIICRNVAIDMYNSKIKKKECEYPEKFIDDRKIINPAEVIVNKESVERISKVIGRLDDKYKDIFILSRVYDISTEDIAKMFGITPDNVRKRLQRAREKILNEYSKEDIK